MEVPNGWLQVLRGPRPPACEMAKGGEVVEGTSAVQQRGGRPVSQWTLARWPRAAACESRRSAPGSTRAGRQVTASSPSVGRHLRTRGGGLRSALEKAKKLSSEPTAEVQITECQNFIAWAEKRVADLDVLRTQEVAALEKGRARLQRLQEMAVAQPVPTVALVQESRCGGVVPQSVAKLEAERIPHPVRNSVDAAESLRKRLTTRKMGNCPEDNIPTDAQDLHSWLESRAVGVARCPRRSRYRISQSVDGIDFQRRFCVAQFESTVDGGPHGALSWVCARNSRYGLRGVKIGEASHPGPPKRVAGDGGTVRSRQRCRSRGNTWISSDVEPLVPFSRTSVMCTRSTVPPSTGPLLDAGVDSQFVQHVAPGVDAPSRDIAAPSTLDTLEEDLLHNNGGSGSSVRQRSIRRLRLVSNNTNFGDDSAASILVEFRGGAVSRNFFDWVAVPALSIEDDVPTTVPASSGQVRVEHEEEASDPGRGWTRPSLT